MKMFQERVELNNTEEIAKQTRGNPDRAAGRAMGNALDASGREPQNLKHKPSPPPPPPPSLSSVLFENPLSCKQSVASNTVPHQTQGPGRDAIE